MVLLEIDFRGIRTIKKTTRGDMPQNEKSKSRRDAQTQNSKTDILILGCPARRGGKSSGGGKRGGMRGGMHCVSMPVCLLCLCVYAPVPVSPKTVGAKTQVV